MLRGLMMFFAALTAVIPGMELQAAGGVNSEIVPIRKPRPVLGLPSSTICAGAIPQGWAVFNVRTNFTMCGGTADNLLDIVDLRGASRGRAITVCSFSAVNNGWTIISTSTDFTKCGRDSGFNNLSAIQKL
jgi:hypothetical protein